MRLSKQGKQSIGIVHILLGLVVLQGLGIVDIIGGIQNLMGGNSGQQDDDDGNVPIVGCPTDGDSTIKFDVKNELNTTGSELYDVTAYLYDSAGALVATVTDTTSPSGTTVNCGETYTGKIVSDDGDGGDNSKMTKDYGDVTVASDGSFSFDAERSTLAFRLKGRPHGVLQFKAYDNNAADWMCNSDDTCTDYEADGVTFTSIVNGTALAVGAGGVLDFTINVQGTGVDNDFQDHYTLLLIEGGASALSVWNTPTVMWDNKALTSYETSLTADENLQFNAYDWVYRIDGPIEDTIHTLRVQMSPGDSQDPSADLEFDFASAGAYLSTNGVNVKVGAAKDDTAHSVVYTVQDVTVDLS